MLEVKNISKIYSNNTGNFDISLTINENEVYGIMGPNGAGKSTFIRQILGFIKSDNGEIKIEGLDCFNKTDEIMLFTGYIPAEVALYDGLTGLQFLKIVSKLKKNIDWGFIEKLLVFFELDANKKIKKMSTGMKQKLAIIAAVMHKPKFLVLDEPTRGLDAVNTSQFYDLVRRFKNEFNATILVCSHAFDEISLICDKVAFIKEGKLVKEYKINESKIEDVQKDFIQLFKTHNVEDLF